MKMRRQDRQLTGEETAAILEKGIYGVLSLAGDFPYGVPLNHVYRDKHLYFHCALEGRKLELIRQDNRASFCVVTEAVPLPNTFSMRYECAMASGRISEVAEAEKREVLLAFIDKYACDDEYRRKGRLYADSDQNITMVLKLEIEQMSGKARR